jgi:hypothetical protein
VLSKNIKIKIYSSMSLHVDLHGCENWSLTLREEHSLKVSENSILRRVCEPKRNELIDGRRQMHSEELHKLYSSPNIFRLMKSRRMRWEGRVTCTGEDEGKERGRRKETTRKT